MKWKDREIIIKDISLSERFFLLIKKVFLVYHQYKLMDIALIRLANWYDKMHRSGFLSFGTIARTIQSHYLNIIHFFDMFYQCGFGIF